MKKSRKGDGRQSGFASQVQRNSRRGIGQRVKEFLKRAGREGKDEVHNRPAEYHARGTYEADSDPHGAGILMATRETLREALCSPWRLPGWLGQAVLASHQTA